MNTKRFAIAAACTFLFVFFYEYLFHAVILSSTYEATKEVWRPHEEEQMIFIFMSQIFFSIVAAYFFTRHYQNKGVGEGLRFGTLIGLLLAAPQLGTYSYLPIPLGLTIAWMVGVFIEGLGAGIVLSLTYKN